MVWSPVKTVHNAFGDGHVYLIIMSISWSRTSPTFSLQDSTVNITYAIEKNSIVHYCVLSWSQ